MTLANAQLRVARPTDNIAALRKFYIDGLGFEILFQFNDHEGFDGLIIGHKQAPYHLEFTTKKGHSVGRAPTQDNLLVFYFSNPEEFDATIDRMEKIEVQTVASFNSYWDDLGAKTFEDPDGYRVVFVNKPWTL